MTNRMGVRTNYALRALPVRVRRIKHSDFVFVRTLASQTQGYTVPPDYVLWMLTRFHSDFCSVAKEVGGERVGYLLAMRTALEDTIFVWQFVATFRGQRLQAARELVKHLKAVAQEHRIRQIVFTCVPRSPAERLVRSVATRIFHVSPVRVRPLSLRLPGGECEYSLTLRAQRR
jgi:hypothetical protein